MELVEPKLFETWNRNYLLNKYLVQKYLLQSAWRMLARRKTSMETYFLRYRYYWYSFKWQYLAGAGAGAGAEIRDNCGAGAKNKQFRLRNTVKGQFNSPTQYFYYPFLHKCTSHSDFSLFDLNPRPLPPQTNELPVSHHINQSLIHQWIILSGKPDL